MDTKQARVAFVGLGHMGAAMASRLLEAGHPLALFNRTRSKAEPFAERGATIASSPAEAARDADILLTMLADDAAVEDAILGEQGAASTLSRGSVHASMSTISPGLSKRLTSAHGALGQLYVAAPVIGRPEAAQRGEITVVEAGSPAAREKCRPVFEVIAKAIRLIGNEPASANVVKLGVNFVLASMLEVLGEAFALGEAHGIPDSSFLEVLNDSLFKSPVIGAYGEKIAANAFSPAGFRMLLGAKDVRLAMEAADRAGVPMPVGTVLRERFAAAVQDGFADEDWAAVGRASTMRRSKATHH